MIVNKNSKRYSKTEIIFLYYNFNSDFKNFYDKKKKIKVKIIEYLKIYY
jgi:hypothetical protein